MKFTRPLTAVALGLALAVAGAAAPASADHYSISDGTTCYGGEIATRTFLTGLVTTDVTPLKTRKDGSVTYSCVFTGLPAQNVDDNGTVQWERPTRATREVLGDSCAILVDPTTEEIRFGTATHKFTPGGTLKLDCVIPPAV
ncbi:hypothetical protein [Aquipuribacter hungaricus]|uniref:Ig-like domain-containing protein n=1 Tax=Aquipuribacter hungaricus TaxID=545624 RepID=A0ABV7WDJ3_9MICO